MSTSFKISESVNFQTILWDVAGFVAGTVRTLIAIDRRTATWRNRQTQRLYADAAIILPALGAVMRALLGLLVAFCGYALPIMGRWAWRALPYAALVTLGAGIAAFIIAYPAIAGCIALIVAYAVAAYPKGA